MTTSAHFSALGGDKFNVSFSLADLSAKAKVNLLHALLSEADAQKILKSLEGTREYAAILKFMETVYDNLGNGA